MLMISITVPDDRSHCFETDAPAEAEPTMSSAQSAGVRTAHLRPSAENRDRDRLYSEFAPLVRRLTRQYGQDADMREDLAGEIYCRFCALLDAYDPNRGIPLRPYLVRQLSLATYTYARQQWRINKRESPWEVEGPRAEQTAAFDPTVDWLASLTQHQAAAVLPHAMKRLPARQRAVVILRYHEERSFEEIAEMMEIQPTTVRSLLRHGLNSLRKAIVAADLL